MRRPHPPTITNPTYLWTSPMAAPSLPGASALPAAAAGRFVPVGAGQAGGQTDDPWDRLACAVSSGSPDGGRDQGLQVADRISNGHAAVVIHLWRAAKLRREGGEDLLHEVGNPDGDFAVGCGGRRA